MKNEACLQGPLNTAMKKRESMPRWLRPKLSKDQVMDLGIAHSLNLDTIARGHADEQILYQFIGGILTWSYVALALKLGEQDMREQSELCDSLVDRFKRTGRVAFTCQEYQIAKRGVIVMDMLAERVDQQTAIIAADKSEAAVNKLFNATENLIYGKN